MRLFAVLLCGHLWADVFLNQYVVDVTVPVVRAVAVTAYLR